MTVLVRHEQATRLNRSSAELPVLRNEGTVMLLTGTAVGGDRVTFAGDHRPMHDLIMAVQQDGQAIARWRPGRCWGRPRPGRDHDPLRAGGAAAPPRRAEGAIARRSWDDMEREYDRVLSAPPGGRRDPGTALRRPAGRRVQSAVWMLILAEYGVELLS
jgi:hypothetical protein